MNLLYFIHRNFKQSTPLVRERAYNVFVRPILEYAVSSWDPYTDYGINRLERVQRKAIRIVLQNFDYEGISTDTLLEQQGWQTLEQRRKIIRLSALHKCKLGYPGLQDLGTFLQQPSYHSARVDNDYKICEIRAKTNQFKNSFLPRTIRDWNKLPNRAFENNQCPGLPGYDQFRHNLKRHFSQKPHSDLTP